MEDTRLIEAAPSQEPAPAREARLLRGATLALFQASDDPVRDRHWLCGPLSRAVASHKSRKGQKICAEFGAALEAGDHAAALEACTQLILYEISSAFAAMETCQ
jgi:hypothetical protein